MVKPVCLTMQAFCTILVLAQKYAKLSLLGNLLEKTGHCLGVPPWLFSDDGGRGGKRPKNCTGWPDWGEPGTGDGGVCADVGEEKKKKISERTNIINNLDQF